MIHRDEQEMKDRLEALEIESYGSWRNWDANQQGRHCTWRGQNRPALRISAARGAGQSKMSFLRTAHASAAGTINTQPGQKSLCTQTALRMANGIWQPHKPIAAGRTDSSYAISCLVYSL